MSGHTPGPWAVARNHTDPAHRNSIIDIEGGEFVNGLSIAIIFGCDRHPEKFANARLIAAAPELVAALRCAEALLDQPVLHTDSDNASGILRGDIRAALVAIRTALAKATGKQP